MPTTKLRSSFTTKELLAACVRVLSEEHGLDAVDVGDAMQFMHDQAELADTSPSVAAMRLLIALCMEGLSVVEAKTKQKVN